jgi:hypothetical protein
MQSLINAVYADLSTLDRDNLADIRDVKIDTSLPVKERINSYIR